LLLRFPSEDARHRRATSQVALANYDATVANYRESTLPVPGNRDDGGVDFRKNVSRRAQDYYRADQ
jgi:hypothetical protein